ncbi:MAG: hypothetical protein ACYCZN_08525 [Candidatus Dormibacteria bacterium]
MGTTTTPGQFPVRRARDVDQLGHFGGWCRGRVKFDGLGRDRQAGYLLVAAAVVEVEVAVARHGDVIGPGANCGQRLGHAAKERPVVSLGLGVGRPDVSIEEDRDLGVDDQVAVGGLDRRRTGAGLPS